MLEQANFEQEILGRYQQLFCAQIFLKFYVKNVTYKNLGSITLPQLYRYIFNLHNLALTCWEVKSWLMLNWLDRGKIRHSRNLTNCQEFYL